MAVTVAQLAVALRIDADGANLESSIEALLVRMLGTGTSLARPDGLRRPRRRQGQAVVLFCQYLYDQPPSPEGELQRRRVALLGRRIPRAALVRPSPTPPSPAPAARSTPLSPYAPPGAPDAVTAEAKTRYTNYIKATPVNGNVSGAWGPQRRRRLPGPVDHPASQEMSLSVGPNPDPAHHPPQSAQRASALRPPQLEGFLSLARSDQLAQWPAARASAAALASSRGRSASAAKASRHPPAETQAQLLDGFLSLHRSDQEAQLLGNAGSVASAPTTGQAPSRAPTSSNGTKRRSTPAEERLMPLAPVPLSFDRRQSSPFTGSEGFGRLARRASPPANALPGRNRLPRSRPRVGSRPPANRPPFRPPHRQAPRFLPPHAPVVQLYDEYRDGVSLPPQTQRPPRAGHHRSRRPTRRYRLGQTRQPGRHRRAQTTHPQRHRRQGRRPHPSRTRTRQRRRQPGPQRASPPPRQGGLRRRPSRRRRGRRGGRSPRLRSLTSGLRFRSLCEAGFLRQARQCRVVLCLEFE